MGAYFFLSEERLEHSRDMYNILKLLGAFGALSSVIFTVHTLIGSYINIKVIRAKIIRSLYFLEQCDHDHKDSGDHEGHVHNYT